MHELQLYNQDDSEVIDIQARIIEPETGLDPERTFAAIIYALIFLGFCLLYAVTLIYKASNHG